VGYDGHVGAQGVRKHDGEVAQAAPTSLAVRGTTVGFAYNPTTAIFFPGPQPSLVNGLYTVMPAHSIGAASSSGMFSGILNVKYWCARTWLE
jgi:hypothetical protein